MFQTLKPAVSSTDDNPSTVSGASQRNDNAPIRDGSQIDTTTTLAAQSNYADEELMNIWLEKAENISKNDPDWMDMSSDALAATVFATQGFVQSITRDSLLLSSYRQNQPVPNQFPLSSQELTLSYNDIAGCVSIENQYAFLSDMIPRTKNLNDLVRENKIRYTTFVNADQAQDIDINNDDTEEE
ncbi:hypothetical protein MOSE0_I07228 [Monosporozyma servazzii]